MFKENGQKKRKGIAACALAIVLSLIIPLAADISVQAGNVKVNLCSIVFYQDGYELAGETVSGDSVTEVYVFRGESITLDITCDHYPDTVYSFYNGTLDHTEDGITYSFDGSQLTITAAEDAEAGYHVAEEVYCSVGTEIDFLRYITAEEVYCSVGTEIDFLRYITYVRVYVCEKSGSCGSSGSDVNYSYDSDTKVLTISGSGEMKSYTYATDNPWYAAWISAESVVIEDGVTGILTGYDLAGFAAMKELYIPEGITAITEGALEGCSSLETVYYGGSVVGWEEILNVYHSETFEGIDIVYGRKADISTEAEISLKDVYAYTGSEITPVTVENTAGTVLEEGVDYTVTYSDNIELGTATVTVTGIGNYTGTVTDTFIIAESASYALCYDPETGLLRYVDSTGNFSDSYTGISSYDGSRYYVENGIVTMTTNGVVEDDGLYYYVVNSKVLDYTGLYEIDGTLYYLKSGQFTYYYTGVILCDGSWYYIEDGIVTMTTTGFVEDDGGSYYYVVNSVVLDYTGLYEIDGTLYYLVNGCFYEVTGVSSYDGSEYYVEDGIVTMTTTGVVEVGEGINRTYFYVVNSKVVTSAGLYKADGVWYYVNSLGVVDYSYTGLAKNDYGWWYVTDGKLDLTYTGMAKNAYGWWYVTDGKLDTTYTGLAENDYGTWYMVNGALASSVSGLTKAGSTWVYLTNGMVNTSYTGLADNDYGTWYINAGYLDTSVSGMTKAGSTWVYLTNGMVDITYTGLAKNAYGWWYINAGYLDLTYTGMAKNDYGWWYVTDGKLDLTYTGMAKNAYGWWYMTNGSLDTSYTGLAENDYGTWYMVNGRLTYYTGTVTIGGVTYTVTNGKVDS